jgi:hypothetical protein
MEYCVSLGCWSISEHKVSGKWDLARTDYEQFPHDFLHQALQDAISKPLASTSVFKAVDASPKVDPTTAC